MKKLPIQLIIKEEEHGQRLDVVVSEKLGITRSQGQKLFELDQVTVNGKLPRKAGDTVREGYEVVVSEATKTTPDFKKVMPINQPKESLKKSAKSLIPKVITETPDYIVIEKPSGLLVHPTQANEKNTLAAWIKKEYPEVKKVGDEPDVRPGIVHRLDKEASGLMVIARTQKMFDHLKEQFKNRTVDKEYFALVHDKVERDEAEINFPIARSGNSERMAARPTVGAPAEGEKEAKTDFLAERHFKNFSLLRVKIYTGRMHQIRVHMLAYNHPLVGDPIYFQRKRRRTWDERLGRMFLHSTLLSFTDLAGRRQTFDSPLPTELKDFLETLAPEKI